jgi:hypothetical protein
MHDERESPKHPVQQCASTTRTPMPKSLWPRARAPANTPSYI